MTYQAIYKCRLCGMIQLGGITGKSIALKISTELSDGIQTEATIPEKNVHWCEDGSFGYADFQGFKVVRE